MAISRQKQRKRWLKVIGPIVVILLIVVAALALLKSQFEGPASSNSLSEERGQIQVAKTLPDLTLTRLEGNTIRFSELQTETHAKVVMVNFWATWCEACMVEMPSIIQLRNKYKDRGFEVLGINLDENPSTVVPKVKKEMGIPFPIFTDPDGKVAEFFDVHAIPLTLILDKNRKILHIQDGELDWNSPSIHSQTERWLSE